MSNADLAVGTSPSEKDGRTGQVSQPVGPAPLETTTDSTRKQRLGLILTLLVTAQFAVIVDYSIVQIALPTIRADLLMTTSAEQWILSAYGLTFAGFLLLSGRLSDIYGRKRLFLLGFMIFSLSSLAAGLAFSELVLISARIVQGFGAAMMSATGLALITRIFGPLGKLNTALGIFTAVSSAGFSSGILLGGFITEALGWRWIFFVNVPVGIIATILAFKILPEPSSGQVGNRHLDIPGAATVTGGLMLLVYGLSEVGSGDTSYLTYLSFVAAGVILASFIAIERRSSAPLMPLSFLRRRTIFFATRPPCSRLRRRCRGRSCWPRTSRCCSAILPIYAAAALVPGALVFFFLGGFAAPRLVRRVGAKPVLVGAMLAFTAGLLLLSRVSTDAGYVTDILPGLLISSVGGALSLTASNIATLSGAHRGEEGVASGLINTSRQNRRPRLGSRWP